jgi:tetratricopeptide (TPR) repeat protein
MRLLNKGEYPSALALFEHSRHQMKLSALAEGRIEARVYADGVEPSVAAVLYQNKLLVASKLPADALADVLRPLLLVELYEKRMGQNAGDAVVYWDGEHAREALEAALAEKCPVYALREHYELAGPERCRRAAPPEGYALRAADAALLEEGLLRTDALREEMCSERTGVEAFLAQSFGVCAVSAGELAGWCLSEYNCRQGCEVGIEVGEWHRRRGLALAMVSAFSEEAARRAVARVGWHCFKSNRASAATALSAGFKKVLDYGCLLCCFEPAVQYAVNGNLCDGAGDFERAVEWYGRALSEKDAPLWAYVRLAMACTALGRLDEAFDALKSAMRKGFNNRAWLMSEPRLEPLRGEDAWRQLF